MEAQLRKATRSDAQAIVALWRALMEEHAEFDKRFAMAAGAGERWARDLPAWVENDLHLNVVAVVEERIVGFLHAYLWVDIPLFEQEQEVYLEDIYLAPAFRKQGIGRRMMAELSAWAQKNGAVGLRLSTLATNPHSNGFWKHLGFEPLAITYTKPIEVSEDGQSEQLPKRKLGFI